MDAVTVFISYSHDSTMHEEHVLELSNALRGMGVEAELDRYHVRPEHGWPHWCEERLKPENSKFVLIICTPTYRKRVENKVDADEGRGVYWEGNLVYDYVYDDKGNTRFIPILLDDAPLDAIPRPLRNHTRYRIRSFDFADPAFEGHPAHVSVMGTGANAIDAAYRVVGALRALETEWNARKAGRPHFESEPHPINLNVGKIEGGDWASSVPAWCRVDFRISIYPGVDAASASREIEQTIAAFARNDVFLSNNPPRLTFNGFFSEGYELSPGTDAERALAQAHLLAVGRPLETVMTPAYLDARVYALYDKIPALCYGPSGRDSHSYDERVSIASVKRITQTIALFMACWCGVEAASP